MEAPSACTSRRRSAFPLLELLEHLPGVFVGNLLPALEPRHKAALALTCSQLCDAVQGSASTLALNTRKCCLSRLHELGARLPNIRHVTLKPGNLHEAMFVLPLFLMQGARAMTGLTSLTLHDLLPDRPPEEDACGSCAALTSTYDLSAILATAAHCVPQLAALDFATHYISDAECAAVGLMSGLTRLHLRATHGTHAGGMRRLRDLPHLAFLELADRSEPSGSPQALHDLTTLLAATRLTHLSLAPHNYTLPLINCLAEMHSQEWQASMEPLSASQQHRQQQGGSSSAAAAAAAARAVLGGAAAGPEPAGALSGAEAREELVSSLLSAGDGPAAAFDASQAVHLPRPPPLVSLKAVLGPLLRSDQILHSLGALVQLTRLELGWVPTADPQGAQHGMAPPWSLAAQQQLCRLTGLCHLGIGWTPLPPLLASLATNTRLTSLQLGGLFSALPTPPAVGALRLPSVVRLTAQLETHVRVLAAAPNQADPEPLAHGRCVDALRAFPSLTRLELCGQLHDEALAALPAVLPSPQTLQELLLPQRLGASNDSLAGLARLSGLMSLRLGWRSLHHDGPAGYAGVPWREGGPHRRLSLAALTSRLLGGGGCAAAAAAGDGRGVAQPHAAAETAGAAAAIAGGAAATVAGAAAGAAGAAGPLAAPDAAAGVEPNAVPGAAGAGPDVQQQQQQQPGAAMGGLETHSGQASSSSPAEPPHAAVASAAASAASISTSSAAPTQCWQCGAGPSLHNHCLCRLRKLEVVGPLPPYELQALSGLPSLRHLVLRDNNSWSSGYPVHDLTALLPRLTCLELYMCEGVEAQALEQLVPAALVAAASAPPGPAVAAALAAAAAAADLALKRCAGPRISVVPRRGITAAELGRGHPFMGVRLTLSEENGSLPDEAEVVSSEYLAPEAVLLQHQPAAPPPPFPQAQHVLVHIGGPHGGGFQVLQHHGHHHGGLMVQLQQVLGQQQQQHVHGNHAGPLMGPMAPPAGPPGYHAQLAPLHIHHGHPGGMLAPPHLPPGLMAALHNIAAQGVHPGAQVQAGAAAAAAGPAVAAPNAEFIDLLAEDSEDDGGGVEDDFGDEDGFGGEGPVGGAGGAGGDGNNAAAGDDEDEDGGEDVVIV